MNALSLPNTWCDLDQAICSVLGLFVTTQGRKHGTHWRGSRVKWDDDTVVMETGVWPSLSHPGQGAIDPTVSWIFVTVALTLCPQLDVVSLDGWSRLLNVLLPTKWEYRGVNSFCVFQFSCKVKSALLCIGTHALHKRTFLVFHSFFPESYPCSSLYCWGIACFKEVPCSLFSKKYLSTPFWIYLTPSHVLACLLVMFLFRPCLEAILLGYHGCSFPVSSRILNFTADSLVLWLFMMPFSCFLSLR